MPSDTNRTRISSAPCPGAWLIPHREAFLAELETLGYAAGTVRHYRDNIDLFCRQVAIRGLGPADIDAAALAQLHQAIPALRTLNARRTRHACISRFTDHLASAGVIAAPAAMTPPPGRLEQLVTDYGDWLRAERGLSASTITGSHHYIRRFLVFLFGDEPGDLNGIGPECVRAFLALPPGIAGRGAGLETKAVELRRLLRFMFATGLTRRDLTCCVPKIASRSRHGASCHLAPGQVQRLVAATGGEDAAGLRDRAVMLLLARLGLRSREVRAIRLDDINWQAGEITIRGKRGYHDRMPLPVDVGEGLADYILNGRRGTSRHLFTALRAPYLPLRTGYFIWRAVVDAFAAAGLTPPAGGVRAHLLRHSLAAGMLDGGSSLDEIGEVLRHRSRAATTIYARHGTLALRPLARAWPIRGECR